MLPKRQLILEYQQFFNEEPPSDRISLIKHIPKNELIYEIAGLNYRLKPFNALYFNYSFRFQIDEIKYFSGGNHDLFNYYVKTVMNYVVEDQYPLIFNRASNLFALEEIINCPYLMEEDAYDMNRLEVWNGILKYYLAVNSEVVKIKQITPENLSFESVSSNSLVLNELSVEANPLFTIYRGICLFNYLFNKSTLKDEFINYFETEVKMDKDEFIYRIMSLAILNKKPNYWEEFVYFLKEPDPLIQYLSILNTENVELGRLITVKKAPFYKDSNLTYVLLDNTFLYSKCYSSFINDFWFNWLKKKINPVGKLPFNYKLYRSEIGYFFEDYVQTIIRNSFELLHQPPALCFKDLKINSTKGHIEIADIYIRMGNRIFVGQVKSGSIYDNEKYSGEISALYKENREKFFSDFGVNQTLESIKMILKDYQKIDATLPINNELEFFPVIIVQESLFQTPLLPSLLNIRFKELLMNENFDHQKIHSLVTIHISDLEYIEHKLKENPALIWELLYSVHEQQEYSYIPPFYSVISDYITEKSVVNRVYDAIEQIRAKYAN